MRYTLIFTLGMVISVFHVELSGQSFAPLGTVWTYEEDDFARPGFRKPFRLYVQEVKMHKGELSSFLSGSQILTERTDGVYFYSEFTEQFELLYPHIATAGDTLTILGLSDQPPPEERCVLRITNVYKDTICDDHIIDVWDTEFIDDPVTGNRYWEIFGRISPQLGSIDHFMFPQNALASPHIRRMRCYEIDTFFCNLTRDDCDAVISSNSDINKLDLGVHFDHNRNICITQIPRNKEAKVQIIAPDGRVVHNAVYPKNTTKAIINLGQPGLFIININIEDYGSKNASIFLP